MNPFDRPDVDVVEVQRGAAVDVVALLGGVYPRPHRALMFVHLADEGAHVRVRMDKRRRRWVCAVHGRSTSGCAHITSAIAALDHLIREDYPTNPRTRSRRNSGRNN